ncbi:MAG: prepilin-type N-terminal cleavage/methylation domain-containing protein [Planctomycetota bacterium]
MKLKTRNSNFSRRAFTLVELMIVVAVLGILAAIVIPEFSGHIQRAKESAAKDNLRLLREAIERYASEHNGIAPGYFQNNPVNAPAQGFFSQQLMGTYISEVPPNPFNNLESVLMLANGAAIPEPSGTAGWYYQASTKTIKLDFLGSDSEGTAYFDY